MAKSMARSILKSEDYAALLHDLKQRIQTAQIKAAVAVNRELILLYWTIGREILIRQQQLGWGAKVVQQLATDLQKAFPEMKGFSLRNLKYMRAFAEAIPMSKSCSSLLHKFPGFTTAYCWKK